MDMSISNPESYRSYIQEGNSTSGEGMQDAESAMELLTRIDLDMACSSEKMVNLHVLITHLLAWDNDLDASASGCSYNFPMSFEKALEFDLLSQILDSQVREVEQFMDNIQAEIRDARDSVFSCRHLKELYNTMKEKLHYLEESFDQCREQLLEVNTQSAKLQRMFSDFRINIWNGKATSLAANGRLPNSIMNSKKLTAEQQRQVLRMLEESLVRELDLEKKLSELRQNEVQLNIKLHHMEEFANRMEEAAEMVWGRFLEAENKAEVLMGISRDMVGHLQIVQFNLNGSFQREAELKSKLQECIQQLQDKNVELKKLESSIVEHATKSSLIPTLMEKVRLLEEQLKKSELRLSNANALNEECQEQLNEMENMVDSLKESLQGAENRVVATDAKVAELTDTNLELTEEINDLKVSRDSDRRKVSLLEKQVRELEIQLQNSKVSSEASQEQQNMLYTAIWDMETLIEDLKSKLSTAESKAEDAEERYQTLCDSNLELNKEVSFLRSRVTALEAYLNQANDLKAASAKEINLRTQLLMDSVMRLARERECIQNQIFSATKKNGILVEKLIGTCDNGDGNHAKKFSAEDCSSNDGSSKISEEML